MKVAIVTDAIWPFTIGGSEIRNHEIAKRLVQKGHEVHIFGAKFWQEKDKTKNIDGVIIHGISEIKKLYDSNGKRKKVDSLRLGIKMFFVLLRADFDIADVAAFSFFNCFSTWAVCLIRRKKLVLTWHQFFGDYLRDTYGKSVGSKIMFLERLTTKLTKHNIAVSEAVKQKIILAGIKPEHITVVPNGVDIDTINHTTPLEEKSDLIFVGRLHYQKNIAFLLDVTAELKKAFPDIRVSIVGDGPDKEILTEKSKTLCITDNINFIGRIEDRNLIYRHLKSSKIFLLPSLLEGFPLTIVEANACGLPAIVSKNKHNNTSEYIRDGQNGFTLELDKIGFCETITKLILDSDRRKKMSLFSIKTAGGYDWDKINEIQEDFYNRVLTN